MDTETVTETEAGTTIKASRKISTTQPRHVTLVRKISNIMLANDAFKDLSHQRPTRKISSSVYHHLSDEKLQSQSMRMSKASDKIENTYKLEPDRTFPYCKVHEIISETLHRHLQGTEYSQRESPYKAKLISDDIKVKVKGLNVCRYRIVCIVHVGCDTGQEIRIASRALWNPQSDTYATSHFKSGKLFAVATVYGVYFE